MLSDPLITITGHPPWADRTAALLSQRGFRSRRYDRPDHLLDELLDHYPVLLLVDGHDPYGLRHTRAVKTEQSTRRIPVLVITSDRAIESSALAVGAEACILVNDVEAQLIATVQRYARLLTPDQRETLLCQCQQALPPLAQLGVQRFNAGAYYAQHDAFEALWMEETGPVRELYRAILQVGVAYYHISRGNHKGGLKMLRRTVQWFAQLPDLCQGIDVRQLREDAKHVRTTLQAMNPADILEFDRTLFRPVPLIAPPPEG
jgi:predicted metal-dependent hydrolase/CheY-like chemotaxis protein